MTRFTWRNIYMAKISLWMIFAITLIFALIHTSLYAQELEGNKKMDMKIEDWKTWCMGRFVMTVPPDAEYHEGFFRYDSSDLSIKPMEPADFQAMLEKRHQELQAIKHDKSPVYLLDSSTIKNVPLSGLFTYYSSDASLVLITLEAYKLQDGLSFKLVTEATPDHMYSAQKLVSEQMKTLVRRSTHEIPTTQGFCFENGFIPDNGNKHVIHNSEFLFPDYPDVALDIDIYDNGNKVKKTTLLQDADKGFAELGDKLKGLVILRRGDRQISDMPGQEILLYGENEGGNMGVLFKWETNGLPDDSTHPNISIEFSTANRFGASTGRPASLTKEEAIALWDQILNTFKLRPVVIPEKPKAQPQTKLGAKISTGEICPQTGYWKSSDGGNKCLLRSGEGVPEAIVRKKLSLIQKLRGDLPNEFIETVWTLLEYTDNKGNAIS